MYYTTIENFQNLTKGAKDISNTKKAYNYIYDYIKAIYFSVKECYKTPSINKMRTEHIIMQKMEKLDCFISSYKIISFNNRQFTCGYIVRVEEKNSHITYLVIETTSNTYIIDASKYDNF